MRKSKKTGAPVIVDAPEFASEAEEAVWWDRHQDLLAELLIKHGRRAVLPTKSVTVRLPVADIDQARKLAARRGMGYQTLIKVILHEGLRRERRKAS